MTYPNSTDLATEAGSRPRVLLVEDNTALRMLMADVLDLDGYQVTQAANADEMRSAIAWAETSRSKRDAFDLVVTDIRMPGQSGLEALSQLRHSGSQSRFLVVTAFPEDATTLRTSELGAPLLAKPFSLAEFRQVVATLVAAPAVSQ